MGMLKLSRVMQGGRIKGAPGALVNGKNVSVKL